MPARMGVAVGCGGRLLRDPLMLGRGKKNIRRFVTTSSALETRAHWSGQQLSFALRKYADGGHDSL